MVAKYREILQDLSQTIATMSPGDRLPSEQQLSVVYGVSGMTVRRALQALSDANRTVGIRGKGTFVARPSVTKRMVLTSFTESMQSAGMTARAEVLFAALEGGDSGAAARLKIPEGEQVFRLIRLRFGDEIPLCIDVSTLRASRFPGLLGHELTGSLYEILRNQYQTEFFRAQSQISAVLANPEQTRLLHMPPGTPCLRVRSRSMTEGGEVAESTESLYRGDLYELLVEPESSPKGTTRT